MLLLTATRLDSEGRFRYSIEKTGYGITYSTENALAVASQLSTMGVPNPYDLLSRARDHGSLEVAAADAAPKQK